MNLAGLWELVLDCFKGGSGGETKRLYISVQLPLCFPVNAPLSQAKTNLPYMIISFCSQQWKQLIGCHMLVDCNYTIIALLTEMRHWNSVWACPVQGSSDCQEQFGTYNIQQTMVCVFADARLQSPRYQGARDGSWRYSFCPREMLWGKPLYNHLSEAIVQKHANC